MKGIRIHGRGGQGAVLAAELLVVAAFEEGKFGQAFPAFGGERRGAPVQAFVRLDSHPVRVRYRVNEPDYVVILDRSLPDLVDVLSGLKPDGLALIDLEGSPADPSPCSGQALAWSTEASVFAVPATRIAIEVFGQPLVNPVMMGALAAATGEIGLQALQQAYVRRFPGPLGTRNSQAIQMGYDFICPAGAPCATPVRVGKSVEADCVAGRPAPGVSPAWPGDCAASPWDAELGGPGRPLHFAQVVAPRTALAYPTGNWRYSRPVIDATACNGCGICPPFCPDGSLRIVGPKADSRDRQAVVDYDYCKGCGICAAECARGAIRMERE